MMLSRSQGCSGSGWPLCTTFSGSKVPFLMAWMRRALFFRRRYLPKVWACCLPRKVRLSCLENIVIEESSRRWDFRARAAPTANTPVAVQALHEVSVSTDARGICGNPFCITGDRALERASTVTKDHWRPHTAAAASTKPHRRESRCISRATIPVQNQCNNKLFHFLYLSKMLFTFAMRAAFHQNYEGLSTLMSCLCAIQPVSMYTSNIVLIDPKIHLTFQDMAKGKAAESQPCKAQETWLQQQTHLQSFPVSVSHKHDALANILKTQHVESTLSGAKPLQVTWPP